jgi:hypothetical protein
VILIRWLAPNQLIRSMLIFISHTFVLGLYVDLAIDLLSLLVRLLANGTLIRTLRDCALVGEEGRHGGGRGLTSLGHYIVGVRTSTRVAAAALYGSHSARIEVHHGC